MNIRASMLPGYNDCTRRAVAKQYKRKFQKLGYEFRELAPSVGSSVGTAVHISTAELDKALWRGEKPNLSVAVDMAVTALVEELSTGCTWDDTTPNMNTAQLQIQRMTECYTPIMPLTVNGEPAVEIGGEMGLQADCGDGWILTGHPDLIDANGFLLDKKTGAKMRPYQGQFGGYSLLVRSNKIIKQLSGVGMLYIARMGKTKHQTPPVLQSYGVALCEREAMGTIHRIKSDMALFDSNGDLNKAFPCNQSSMMCTPKYCPAFGTDFCELTK